MQNSEEVCFYCGKGFEEEHNFLYTVKEGKVVRVHRNCQKSFEHGSDLNIRIRVMPGRGESSYGTKFMKGRR